MLCPGAFYVTWLSKHEVKHSSAQFPVNSSNADILKTALSFVDESCGGTPVQTLLTDIIFNDIPLGLTITEA